MKPRFRVTQRGDRDGMYYCNTSDTAKNLTLFCGGLPNGSNRRTATSTP
jgi:hypothetical protein